MKHLLAALLTVAFLGVAPTPGESDENREHVCFRTLDANQDGVVSLEEFAGHYGDDRKRFDAADTDKDGQLTHDEYHAMLGHGAQ